MIHEEKFTVEDVGTWVHSRSIPGILAGVTETRLTIVYLDGSGFETTRPNDGTYVRATKEQIIRELESYAQELRDAQRN